MAKVTWVQNNFNGGEWSPLTYGRFDLAKYKNGMAQLLNYLPTQQGGLTRRSGTRHVALVKDSSYAPRLRRFEFSVEQAYMLEFGDGYIRFYADDAQLVNSSTPYEVATTYSAADAWMLGFDQTADTLYISHPDKPTMKLQRVQSTPTHLWTLTAVSFLDGPYLAVNATSTTLTPSGTLATATASRTGAAVSAIAITNGGRGYGATPPTVTISGGGGSGATATAVVTAGVVTAITVTVGGTGYTSDPTVTLSAPGATAGTVTVTASAVTGINGGAGFRASDMGRMLRVKCGGIWLWGLIAGVTDSTHCEWTISDPDGERLPITAAAIANVSGGSVFSVSITDGGSGYGAQPPSVSFSGGGGSGAIAYATVTNGVVTGITMSVTGTGYTSTPTVTLSGPTAIVASTTTFWRLGLWNATDGYPCCVTFHQNRLCLGGAKQSPGRVDGSNTADYENFAPTNLDGTVVDSNALAFTLDSGAGASAWLVSDEWGLLVGTAGGEWVISPSSTQQALTPTNVNIKQLSNYGSSKIAPLRVGKAVLFVQRTGRKLRELVYQFAVNTFEAFDLSLIGEHLTKGGLKQMALQLAPQQLVWISCNDGRLAGVTYDKAQEICGWHGHRLGGYSDAGQSLAPLVESVDGIPAPGIQRDEVWLVVKRYVNGQVQRSVEVMAKLWEDGDSLSHCVFLDASAEYDGAPTTTVTVPWLANQTVGVLADGSTHPDCVANGSGQITLQREARVVQVGLKYASRARTLRIEAGGENGPSHGKLKRICKAVLRFVQSIGLSVGSSSTGDNSYPEPFRTSADLMDGPVGLFDGDKKWSYEGTWDLEGQIYFETTDPLPSNITMLMAQMETQDAQ